MSEDVFDYENCLKRAEDARQQARAENNPHHRAAYTQLAELYFELALAMKVNGLHGLPCLRKQSNPGPVTSKGLGKKPAP